MGRPDYSLIARQDRSIFDNVGETALLYAYVSADTVLTANEAAGVGPSIYTVARVVTGLFAPPPQGESYMAGGYAVTGDMAATLIDVIPRQDDDVIWRGISYRVVSDPIPQQILGRSAYRFLLQRGQPLAG